jgi:2-polyprenyl-3-methyl-5-hydroxy-6-metoxy-1,4-benzoquinol methylase
MKTFEVCCPICRGETKKVLELNKKLNSENIFGLKESLYHRILFNCLVCDHYFNFHKQEKFLDNIYRQNYSTYSYKKVNESFKKIISLPKKKSSNFYRVLNLRKFLKRKKIKNPKILDYGSGTGVFTYLMKNLGFNIMFCEKNIPCYNFLKNDLKIKPFCKGLLKIKKNTKFNLITSNKVLEHLSNKVLFKVLNKFRKLLSKKGVLYIELPDGPSARKVSLKRQEFFFEHFNIFSKKSIKILLKDFGFKILKIQKVYEVNKKFTLRIFAQKIN